MSDNVFCSDKFLDELTCEGNRQFWEKILNTQAFEYFILSNQYIDDSPTKLFKNV